MKAFRLFIFFLLAIILTTAALSFLMATHQKVERSVIIKAPAATIYAELAQLENFHRFSVWSRQDSSAIYRLEGKDGSIGAASVWEGSPEISGAGKIEIKALEQDRKIVHHLTFTKPKKGAAESVFLLEEKDRHQTTVTWIFTLATPRPSNIFNLMYSLDEKMGADFENGLKSLKSFIEQGRQQSDSTLIN